MEIYATALGAIVCAVVSGYFGLRMKKAEMQLKHAEFQIKTEREALSFEDYFAEAGRLFMDIEVLCRETEIDRVLLLVAWNGRMAPRWTTAIWQYRTGEQIPQSYVHTELDADYVERLKEIRITSCGKDWKVEEMPNSLIKSIYESEGVKASSWHMIREREKGEGVAVTYMSFATHTIESIHVCTKTKCGIIANRIAGAAVSNNE